MEGEDCGSPGQGGAGAQSPWSEASPGSCALGRPRRRPRGLSASTRSCCTGRKMRLRPHGSFTTKLSDTQQTLSQELQTSGHQPAGPAWGPQLVIGVQQGRGLTPRDAWSWAAVRGASGPWNPGSWQVEGGVGKRGGSCCFGTLGKTSTNFPVLSLSVLPCEVRDGPWWFLEPRTARTLWNFTVTLQLSFAEWSSSFGAGALCCAKKN